AWIQGVMDVMLENVILFDGSRSAKTEIVNAVVRHEPGHAIGENIVLPHAESPNEGIAQNIGVVFRSRRFRVVLLQAESEFIIPDDDIEVALAHSAGKVRLASNADKRMGFVKRSSRVREGACVAKSAKPDF